MIRWLIVITSVLSLYSQCFATPSVTGLAGTLTSGSAITVTGTGFGTHADYNAGDANKLNFIWHTFEDGNLTSAEVIQASPTGYWIVESSTGRTNSAYWARRVNVNGTIEVPVDDNTHGLRSATVESPGTYFISMWFKTISGSEAYKFFRCSDIAAINEPDFFASTGGFTGGDTPDMRIRFSTECTVLGDPPCPQSTNYDSDINMPSDETWVRVDIYLDGPNNLQDCYVVGLNNNEDVWPVDLYMSGPMNSSFIANIGAGMKGRGEAEIPNNYYGLDDIFIDFTAARVEICTAADGTWASRSVCEIQIPTTWSDTAVTFTVNRGAYAVDGSAYLFVIDSDNSADPTGYPITFGSSYNVEAISGCSFTGGTLQ